MGALSLAIWVYLFFLRGRFWAFRPARPEREAPPAHVIAVIPARDEAGLIGQAVASLAAQQYLGRLDIVVVDDHSSDGTAEEARAAATPERLTVLTSAPLPAGWTGKLWAVSQGIAAASLRSPDYLLLTDADIVHEPGNVAALVARAHRENLDLASLMVRLRCESLAEKAAIPAFVYFFFQLYPPRWIAHPRSRTAGAAGGCMLVRRAALDQAGGIEAIRAELIDDCALAALLKQRGSRIWLGLSDGTCSIRAYETAGPIWRMISRTAFTQLRHSTVLLAGTGAGLVLTYLVPPLLTLLAHGTARWFGIAAWLLMTASYVPAVRYYRLSPLWAATLPLTAVFYLAATINSARTTWRGQGGVWKGRAQDTRA